MTQQIEFNSVFGSENLEDEYDFSDKELIITTFFRFAPQKRIVIKCVRILVTADSAHLENIDLYGSIVFRKVNSAKLINCNVYGEDSGSGASVVASSSTVSIQNSTFHPKSCGIFGEYATFFEILDCKLIGGEMQQILISAESILICRRCQFSDSKSNMIAAFLSPNVFIESCKFTNSVCPVVFMQQCRFFIKQCQVNKVGQNGITILNESNGQLIQCTFNEIESSAISLNQNSTAVLLENQFTLIKGNAFYIADSSNALIKRNSIRDSIFPGIAILDNCQANINENTISGTVRCGICIRGASKVNLKLNKIEKVGECAISVSDSQNVSVEENTIQNCPIAGIEAYNLGNVFIIGNTISNPGEYGFLSYAGANLDAHDNKISGFTKALAKITYQGNGIFHDNVLSLDNPDKVQEIISETKGKIVSYNNLPFPGVTNQPQEQKGTMQLIPPYVDPHERLCLKCGKKPRSVFFDPCGHRILCEDCAKSAFENHEKCALCRFPIEKITVGFMASDEQCMICMENPSTCVVLPCGHIGFCYDCLVQWYQENSGCPVCRASPSYFKRIITSI